MEQRLHELKNNFTNIVSTREDILSIMESVNQRIEKLKELYSEFVKNNKKNLFVFGLDSFHFQSKLVDIEYEDLKRIFCIINNRMYCEYYKLYKIVTEYISHDVTDKKIVESVNLNNNFQAYKDLEPFKQYNFEHVKELHENVVLLLNLISNYLTSKKCELQSHETKRYIGLNIDNFVSTFSYDIFVMREKVNLFISYIEFFHNLHGKFLDRFLKKMQFLMDQLNTDINFEKKEESKNDEVNKEDGRFQRIFQTGVKTVGNALSFIKKKQDKLHDKTNHLDVTKIRNVEKVTEYYEAKDEDNEIFIKELKEMESDYERNMDEVILEILEESDTETIVEDFACVVVPSLVEALAEPFLEPSLVEQSEV